MTNLLHRIVVASSLAEPHAGGKGMFAEQIKASLPFLRLIPQAKRAVLVVGCGEGYEVKWLTDQGFAAVGVTNSRKETRAGKRKYGVTLEVADMHTLPFPDITFDCIYAANILEHSVAPLIALQEWRRVLRPNGWLIVVMPSKEWIKEYYHFSVLTHSQTKDLLVKIGFQILAGPEMRALIDLGDGDIFYDLGRGWGHYDGYVARRTALPKEKFMLGNVGPPATVSLGLLQLVKQLLKRPYNFVRVWRARYHHE